MGKQTADPRPAAGDGGGMIGRHRKHFRGSDCGTWWLHQTDRATSITQNADIRLPRRVDGRPETQFRVGGTV